MTPDLSILPEQPLGTTMRWLVYATAEKDSREGIAIFDPSGKIPGNILREAAISRAFLTPNGPYFLTGMKDTSKLWTFLSEEYMFPRDIAQLGTTPDLVTLSLDGQSLVWGKPSNGNETMAEAFLTSLESGETRSLVTVKVPRYGEGYDLKPLFYDAERGYLLYAFHDFHSDMSLTQVVSLYLLNLRTGESTDLVPLSQSLYAGYSAAVDPAGETLAYLVWHGELDAEFNLSWQLHLRSLQDGQEKRVKLAQPAAYAEVYFFSPDSRWILIRTSRRLQNGTSTAGALLLFDMQTQTFTPLPEMGETFYEPRAWSKDGWLVLTSDTDLSTWAMRPLETQPVRVTPFRFLGLIGDS